MIIFYLMSGRYRTIVDFSRGLIVLFYLINIVLTVLYRLIIRRILYYIRRRGNNLKHVLLVGYSRAAEAYLDRLQNNSQWGYVAHGILDDHVPAGTMYKGVKVLGDDLGAFLCLIADAEVGEGYHFFLFVVMSKFRYIVISRFRYSEIPLFRYSGISL